MKITYSFDDIQTVIVTLAKSVSGKKIIAFSGMLGAGKTTIIRELLCTWGINQGVTSPTFTYMNQYVTSDGLKIFHFDLYRITTSDEFRALGFDEYLHRENSMVLIEWPEVIADVLRNMDVCYVKLEYDESDNNKRTMKIDEE